MFNKTKIIAFLGPDGSGKTTIIKLLKKKISKKNISSKQYHLFPHFFENRKTIIVKNPHSKKPRSKFLSFLKIILWLIKYKIFIIINFFLKYKIVIFDRYAHDILIDPLRYRFNLNLKLTNFILKMFPQPNLWVIMVNKPSIIWKRKKEVEYKILARQLKDYKKFAKKNSNSIICKDTKDINKIIKYLSNFNET